MRLAIRVARRGIGSTHPNLESAPVILRGRECVASGCHLRAARRTPVQALSAREQALGATLVVALEPCAHFGRTPPCVDAIVRSGIRVS